MRATGPSILAAALALAGACAHPNGSSPAPPGACRANADCVGERMYCDTSPACGPKAAGRCEARPDACVQVYDPVEGCDGKRYSNACAAAQAGVSVKGKARRP